LQLITVFDPDTFLVLIFFNQSVHIKPVLLRLVVGVFTADIMKCTRLILAAQSFTNIVNLIAMVKVGVHYVLLVNLI